MRNRVQRRLFTLLLALMTILPLTIGCQQGDQTTAAPQATEAPEAAAETTRAKEATATPEPDTDDGPAEKPEYAEEMTISMCVLDLEKTGKTDRDAWFNEKFNVKWDFRPVTWGDWTEKVRAWVGGDDLPDILWWDMKISHTAEFKTWAQNGAFTEIPSDMSRWPNLAALRESLVSDDAMLTVDGKLFGWPSARNNPEWTQNVYYPLFAYRRDWAKAVGLYQEDEQYTWDEVKEMIDAVKAQDPGGNGVDATFGMTSETWAFPGVYMEILGYGEDRNTYVLRDGGYVPYFTTDEMREELKFVVDLFQEGYIWKDQIVDTGSGGADNFKAGKAFMHLGNNSADWFSGVYPSMVDTGVIESTEDIGPMIVFSPKDDKSFWLTQTEDYWTVSNLRHSMEDAKRDRILDMWDWLASEEGRIFLVAGLEGKDYEKQADGSYKILWEQNPDGSFKSPYVDTASNMYTPATLVPSPHETTRMEGYEAFEGIFDFMRNSPDFHVHTLNWDVQTFGGEQFALYGGFGSDVSAKQVEIIAAGGDVDAAWDAFLDEMEPKWRPVADELNAGLGG